MVKLLSSGVEYIVGCEKVGVLVGKFASEFIEFVALEKICVGLLAVHSMYRGRFFTFKKINASELWILMIRKEFVILEEVFARVFTAVLSH